MIRLPIRPILCTAAAALLVVAATGCEPPPPPPPTLAVNSSANAPDAAPGDGVCEITPGAGDCSLRAAIDEGNVLGRARITLPKASYGLDATTVTGDLLVTGDVGPGLLDMPSINAQQVRVAPGGRLELNGLQGGGNFTVEGAFVGRDLYLGTLGEPVVTVLPGGTGGLENSILFNLNGGGVVKSSGTVVLSYSALVGGTSGARALENTGTAYTVATHLQGCGGTSPVSLGYSADADGSCALAGPTDHPSVGLRFATPRPPYAALYSLEPDSPLVDAIPVGVLGCGTTVPDDFFGTVRPTDGDEDGTNGCDIGASELYDFASPG